MGAQTMADELIAEIERTDDIDVENGRREWMVVRRAPGWVHLSVEYMRTDDTERRVDPEAGLCFEDKFLEAMITSLQAART